MCSLHLWIEHTCPTSYEGSKNNDFNPFEGNLSVGVWTIPASRKLTHSCMSWHHCVTFSDQRIASLECFVSPPMELCFEHHSLCLSCTTTYLRTGNTATSWCHLRRPVIKSRNSLSSNLPFFLINKFALVIHLSMTYWSRSGSTNEIRRIDWRNSSS